MKYIKNIFSFILSLMLMFTLILSIFFIFFKGTLSNENLYLDAFKKNGISEKIYESINDKTTYLMMTNNLPLDTLKDIITIEEVNAELYNSVHYVKDYFFNYNKEIPILNKEKYIERFDIRINDFFKDNGLHITDELSKDVKEIKSTTLSVIEGELQVIDLNKLSTSSSGSKIRKVILFINSDESLAVLIVITTVLFLMLLLMWHRRPYKAAAWTGYSAVASGLMVFLVFFSGYLSKFYDNVLISIPYLKEVVVQIISSSLIKLSIFGAVLVLIGLIFMSFYWVHLYKRYYGKRKKRVEDI